jgi:hypothetical protein
MSLVLNVGIALLLSLSINVLNVGISGFLASASEVLVPRPNAMLLNLLNRASILKIGCDGSVLLFCYSFIWLLKV